MKSIHSKKMGGGMVGEREGQVALKDEVEELEEIREDRVLGNGKKN